MQTFFYLAAAAIIFWSCTNQDSDKKKSADSVNATIQASSENAAQDSVFLKNLFTESDAVKILGEPVNLTESKATVKKDTLEYRSTYTAKNKDPRSGKTGAIYFIIEKYTSVSAAHDNYELIRKSNEKHPGVKILTGFGDEAYFHSDGENFYFILARKGDKMFRIKVNKTTSTTSPDAFNLISKRISENL